MGLWGASGNWTRKEGSALDRSCVGRTGHRKRYHFARGDAAAIATGTAQMWLRGDLVGKRRGGTSHQSGQWFTETRRTTRKAERGALNVLRGPACLCITV